MTADSTLHDAATEAILDRFKSEPAPFLSILHEIQRTHGHLPENSLRQVADELGLPISELYGTVTFYHYFRLEPKAGPEDLLVCENSACCLHDLDQLGAELAQADLGVPHSGKVKPMPCPGRCDVGVPVFVGEKVFTHARPGALEEIKPAEIPDPPQTPYEECLFTHIREDITHLSAYLAIGGYESLKKVSGDPEAGIEELKKSGLTGRGGAGFPTGVKWAAVRGESEALKFIVCNADEGEVGCFKDRLILAKNPHAMLEGMAAASLITGANVGIIYLRWEYPELEESLQRAIDEATAAGFLGENILDTSHSFRMYIRRGAGAYICGEETSLLNSLEGKHPFPRDKPPFPTTHGLFGKPTVINNVETFAAASVILNRGGEWYRSLGVGENAGTRIFSVSGDIQRPGNYEVPVGTPLSTLLKDLAGGAGEGRTIKGVTMAGISGGFVGAADLDVPLDADSLRQLGGMLGAGGIVVHDDTRSMVEAARASMHFLAHESCGKCFPCRIGTTRVTEILDEMIGHVRDGRSLRPDPMREIEDLEQVMAEASACGLGQAAPFVTRMLKKYWPEEVQAHLDGP